MNKSYINYKRYLVDLSPLILERAYHAKKNRAEAEKGSPGYDFEDGRLMAFFEIVSIMQDQAPLFDIDLRDIGLNEVDPYKDLI